MDKKQPTKKELLDFLYSLPLDEFSKIVKDYDKIHKSKINKELSNLYISDLERKLIEAGVNATCPYCSSSNFVKRGRSANFQRYLCQDCDKSFTSATNTFLEKSKFSWEVWVKLLEMTINGYPIKDTMNVIEKDYGYDGISNISVLLARHKLLNAISLIPQPKLTGVIQIDETFFRESQKGVRPKDGENTGLINYIPSVQEYRKPRYGVQPSILGVMGAEFANVPVAVDNTGHVVAKVACLGRLTIEIFTDLFHDHLDNPAFICTDANPIYKRYCKVFSIPHYIRPSDYHKVIKKAGYDQPLYPDKDYNTTVSDNNFKILEKLYNADLIDRIENKGNLTFKEFNNIKKTYGLNLGRVNQQHNELKRDINKNKTNVSTKFLDKYISFYVFLHNWSIDKDKYPSSFKDAEEILIHILSVVPNSSFTLEDFRNTKLTLPKPTTKYIDLLAAMTSEARKEFNNKYLKFNEEDRVYNFKKKEYLLDCPRYLINEMAKQYGIPCRNTISIGKVVNDLMKLEDIDIIMVKLLLKEKNIYIAQEDADILEYFRLEPDNLGYDAPMNEDFSKHYSPVKEDSPLYNPNSYFTGQQLVDYQDGPKMPENEILEWKGVDDWDEDES